MRRPATDVRRVARWLGAVVTALVVAAGLLLATQLGDMRTPEGKDMALVKVKHATGVDAGAGKKGVIWLLAVGSDARQGQNMLRTRGDALQLIGINTRTGAATSIGVPRDSWVHIPGHGSSRINASLSFGGPKLLGRTVGNLVGVQPRYVFVTRFQGLRDMIDDIGGITVKNPRPFADSNLWPQGFKAGRIKLGGHAATAFSRSRHGLPRGDFDRSANQQRVVRAIQQKVRKHRDDLGFMARGVKTVTKHLYTDLPARELYRLAYAVARVDPGKVTGCVVQGGIANIGGASVVIPHVAAARAMGKDARRDATISHCR